MKLNIGYIKISLIVFIIISFISCSIERKYAEEFVNKRIESSVLLIKPTILINTNKKTTIVDTLKDIDQYTKDSILNESSVFLKDIIDSAFLSIYYNTLIDVLKEYPIKVFTDTQTAVFFHDTLNSFVVNIAQNELEEDEVLYRDEMEVDTFIFFKEVPLKAVTLNNWIEISSINDTSSKNSRIFFSSQYAGDEIKGKFRKDYFTGQIEYFYSQTDITLESVYNLAYYAAVINANYIYDYLMNYYVYRKTGKKPTAEPYFHFYNVRGTVIRAYSDRFEEVKQ